MWSINLLLFRGFLSADIVRNSLLMEKFSYTCYIYYDLSKVVTMNVTSVKTSISVMVTIHLVMIL